MSASRMLLSGLPAVVALHVSDNVGFVALALFDQLYDGHSCTAKELRLKKAIEVLYVYLITLASRCLF
jgi:hypothetical protein